MFHQIRDTMPNGADRINIVGIALTATIGVAALIIAFLTYRIQQARGHAHDEETATATLQDLSALHSSTYLEPTSERLVSNPSSSPRSLTGASACESDAVHT